PLPGRAPLDHPLWAGGRTPGAIAPARGDTAAPAEKHVAAVFDKLGLPASHDANRRVLAVLRYLRD
ncbi:DNA-binding response regulator, partial [Streptomyces lasiicapitis]